MTSLSILRAALERIAKLGGPEIDEKPTCLQCCESLEACDTDNAWCPGRQARAALEAAAKAPGLADDTWRGTFYTWISSTRHRAGNWPQRALDATLDALDAYQRGK